MGLQSVTPSLFTGGIQVNDLSALPQIYVAPSPTGNDSNTGLTSGSPLATLQAAIDLAIQFDVSNGGGSGIVINLAAGTWTTGCVINGGNRGGCSGLNNLGAHITLAGAGATSSVINDTSGAAAAIIAINGARVALQGIGIGSTGGSGIFPSYDAVLALTGAVQFNACHFGQIHAETGGTCYVVGTSGYTIAGGAPAHWECVLDGRIILSEAAKTITLSGSPVFSQAFASMLDKTMLYCPSGFITFSGSPGATTYRYDVGPGSVIETNNGGPSYFPGTEPGYVWGGGQYLPVPLPSIGTITGFGSGAAAVLTTYPQSNDYVGLIQITTGSSPSSEGTIALNFGGGATLPHGCVGTFTLQNGTGTLNANAIASCNSFQQLPPQYTITIGNNGVNFPSGNFYLQYAFTPF